MTAYEVGGLTKTYRGATRPANVDIDLVVPAGEIFGLLGPNGAGKTTLVRQLVGLLRPDTGSVRLLGHDVVADPARAARLIGYLGQDEPALAELSVRTAVETTARLRGVPRREAVGAATALLDELALGPLAGVPLVRLSGGQRRLACVASALAADRPVLILDEPTTGLDPVARRAIWSALRRRRAESGTTVVLVTHNVLEAETVLDRVAVLDAGRVIACDTPGQLKAAVDRTARIELVWHRDPPRDNPDVDALARSAEIHGQRWIIRVERDQVPEMVARLTGDGLYEWVDDFAVSSASLEDVYLALGGRHADFLPAAVE